MRDTVTYSLSSASSPAEPVVSPKRADHFLTPPPHPNGAFTGNCCWCTYIRPYHRVTLPLVQPQTLHWKRSSPLKSHVHSSSRPLRSTSGCCHGADLRSPEGLTQPEPRDPASVHSGSLEEACQTCTRDVLAGEGTVNVPTKGDRSPDVCWMRV